MRAPNSGKILTNDKVPQSVWRRSMSEPEYTLLSVFNLYYPNIFSYMQYLAAKRIHNDKSEHNAT